MADCGISSSLSHLLSRQKVTVTQQYLRVITGQEDGCCTLVAHQHLWKPLQKQVKVPVVPGLSSKAGEQTPTLSHVF